MNNSLIDFFYDREIFITGGSGFIGKGLIEKILRSFTVKRIYVLLREKKGISPLERIEELKKDQIFDVLRKAKPNELNKLTVISGDVSKLGLLLTDASIRILQNVSLIIHSAATIRFDEPLKTAILINVRGTREVLRIAEKLPKLQMFLHISTLFSNCNLEFIDEKIYPPPANCENIIKIAENVNESDLLCLSYKLTEGFPNIYTFTKSLSEHVVNEFKDKLPIVIIRPSIVLCALFDPIPGYTDNLSGSMSVAIAGGAGILRNLLCDPDMTPNQVSLDLVTRIAILSIWKAASLNRNKLPFICNISGEQFPEFSIRVQLKILDKIWQETPYGKMFWKPSVYPTSNERYFFLRFLFTQLIPAVIGDAALKIMGKRPVLIKFQRIILNAVKGFQFFLSSPIKSGTKNMVSIMNESKRFPGFEARHKFIRESEEYGKIVAMSCRQFLLKEKDSDLPRARILYKRLCFADGVLKCLLILAVLFILFNIIF